LKLRRYFNLSYGYSNQRLSLYPNFSDIKTGAHCWFYLRISRLPHRVTARLILHRSVYCCARKFCALWSDNSWRHMFLLAVSTSPPYITVQ